MLTRTRVGLWAYPTRAEFFYPRLHWNGWLPQRKLILYLIGLIVIVQVSYGYGYTRGLGRVWSINNGTDINACSCWAIRDANWGPSERTSELLIKKFVRSFPFPSVFVPSSLLIFLLPSFPHLLPANSAFHLSGVGKWVPSSAGKAKAGTVHSVSGCTRGVQVKLWDPLRTRAIAKRLKGVFTTRHYANHHHHHHLFAKNTHNTTFMKNK